MSQEPETDRIVGNIGNYYGRLEVSQKGGRYFWAIRDWSDTTWEEIPQYLYDALMRYQNRIEDEDQNYCLKVSGSYVKEYHDRRFGDTFVFTDDKTQALPLNYDQIYTITRRSPLDKLSVLDVAIESLGSE